MRRGGQTVKDLRTLGYTVHADPALEPTDTRLAGAADAASVGQQRGRISQAAAAASPQTTRARAAAPAARATPPATATPAAGARPPVAFTTSRSR
jgi:hypothetical protein